MSTAFVCLYLYNHQMRCIMVEGRGNIGSTLLHRVIHNVIVSASHFLSLFTKANSIVHNCAPVTKHWHTLMCPFSQFLLLSEGPHWLFDLGGDLCREIRIWWLWWWGGGLAKDWHWVHNMERQQLCLFFPSSLPCLCSLFYPWTWMHKGFQLIFYSSAANPERCVQLAAAQL